MPRKMKYDYFKAFESQVDIALAEADLLITVIRDFTTAEAVKDILPEAHDLEHRGDTINHNIYTALATDFITPIDRDDILQIAQALDNVIDYIEDVIRMFYVMDVHFMHRDLEQVGILIKKSCEALKVGMREFTNFKKSAMFKRVLVEVNDYEEEADRLYDEMTHNLYTKDADNPLRVIVWSRIFAKIEKCSDACEHVADIMGTVLLKNS